MSQAIVECIELLRVDQAPYIDLSVHPRMRVVGESGVDDAEAWSCVGVWLVCMPTAAAACASRQAILRSTLG